MPYQPFSLNNRAQLVIKESASRSSAAHAEFLQSQTVSLKQIEMLLELQITAAGSSQGASLNRTVATVQPLFDTVRMNEFATGSMARCFGPEFLVFEGHRYPRIPNGDLMLMSRVLEIHGKRGQFKGESRIVVEYDVPADAWFFKDSGYPSLPYSVMMEIALQPCGFLAAYLGTSLALPNVDFYFRNLDGKAHVFSDPDLRGQTITCSAVLTSTIVSDDTIIQKFKFELSSNGEMFYQGGSIFGFFSPEAMVKQTGLDGGIFVIPAVEKGPIAGGNGEWIDLRAPQLPGFLTGGQFYCIPVRQLEFLDRVYLEGNAPDGRGDYVYAERKNNPDAWFYSCHFFQDPVMPGSLGVEAILEAMKVYALRKGIGNRFRSPRFGLAPTQDIEWKYRGQILPAHKDMKLEVSISGIQDDGKNIIITGNASLWADAIRIYEIKNAAICVSEAG